MKTFLKTPVLTVLLGGVIAFASQSVLAACNANVLESTPTADFTDHGNGTVTHNKTGLMWKVCSEGMNWDGSSCAGSATFMTWEDALITADTVNNGGGFAGHSDWYLPNAKELKSILELRCSNPAINTTVFKDNATTFYWSSTPNGGVLDDRSIYVNFYSGFTSEYGRSNSMKARLVRNTANDL